MGFVSSAPQPPAQPRTLPYNSVLSSVRFRTATIVALQAVNVVRGTMPAVAQPPLSVAGLALTMRANVIGGNVLQRLRFNLGASSYAAASDGAVLRDQSPATGVGTPAGTLQPTTGLVSIQSWPAGAPSMPTGFAAVQAPPGDGPSAPFLASQVLFRTATAPLRPGSLSIVANLQDGTAINVTAGADGKINAARVKGFVNHETGVVELYFTNPAIVMGPNTPKVDVTAIGIAGLGEIPLDLVRTSTIRYNAVSYTYLPLDASILGLDPVRLPSDGRVPVFKSGRVVVVHNTQTLGPQTVANGQTVDTGRVLLSRLRVIGSDGLEITSGFTRNLDAGTVTFTNVAGFSQPVTIEHRIEDEALCAEAQITGDLRLARPLTHNYPVPGSFVSSALVVGTLQSAAQDGFSQEAWTSAWADVAVGNPVLAQYDDTTHPVAVTNAGAITERWAIIFTSNTAFILVGEQVGQIIAGNTAADLSPVNPATGVPYFTLAAAGWGSGWAAGNVYRFNTKGANFPLWVARTVLQSPSAPPGTDQVTIAVRGDIDQ